MAVILSKTREFWVKKEAVLGPGTELLYVLRSIYKSDTRYCRRTGIQRVREERKRRIRMEGDQRPFSTQKKMKARTLEGLWTIKHGVCQFCIVQEMSALLAP